jgi:hypothetical protein
VSSSSFCVGVAAALFLIAAFLAVAEGKPFALVFAYASLALANAGFSQLD